MTRERITLNTILQHKEYFDYKLIEIADHLSWKEADLNAENKRITINNQKLTKTNHDIRLKLCDMEAVQYKLNQNLKEKEEEISNLIKDFEKEIKEQEKIIKGELQHSYEENNKLHNENETLREERERLRKEIEKLRKENNRYKRMSKETPVIPAFPHQKTNTERSRTQGKRAS